MISPLEKVVPLLLLALAIPVSADGTRPDRSVPYKKVGGVELKLDVFEPAGLKPGDRRSAIIFFFGGGWNSGTPSQFYPQAKTMAAQGMVAFSAEYRVKSRNQTTPFECVKDGKSAIRWVRGHAAEFGIDPGRIVAAGGSAGGHVAACTGIIEGTEEAGESTKISSTPNALILFNPVLDTTARGFGARNFATAEQTTISPCHHVRKELPPTLVFHGTADTTVPFENAERFAGLMKAAGNECELVPFSGKGHGFFNGSAFRKGSTDTDYDLTLKHAVRFLNAHGFLK